MAKASNKIRVTYNAPVTLTFTFLSIAILLISSFLWKPLISFIFTCPGGKSSPNPFNFSAPLDYLRIILHIFGNTNWNQFISNFAFILLLGPVLEEKYGSPLLSLMMAITSLVSGVLNACFGANVLTGSSDIVFMMVLLVSFNSISKKQIPLSFILVLILYIGREVLSLISGNFSENGFSTLAHITGGICGSLFAFLATPKSKSKPSETKQAVTKGRKNVRTKKNHDEDETDLFFPKPDKKSQARLEEIDNDSPRFKNKPQEESNDESATIVGTIEL